MTKKTAGTVSAGKSAPKGKTADKVDEGPSPAVIQLKTYEKAVGLFSQRKFGEACGVFREAVTGPARDIADKAKSYAQVCERRMGSFDLQLHTAEDHFNYGVERLNARDVERARDHLGRAMKLSPDADHIYYAMALCCGLSGDGEGACENLKRAIDIDPRNRILARQDPEFVAMAPTLPQLRAMLSLD
jgi:Tfp pilus assembly protein PilF